jgi:hypothetical protein
MVCPTCGLDNDPQSSLCARCNTALTPAPAPLAAPSASPPASGFPPPGHAAPGHAAPGHPAPGNPASSGDPASSSDPTVPGYQPPPASDPTVPGHLPPATSAGPTVHGTPTAPIHPQPGHPAQPGYPTAQPGYPTAQAGYPAAQPGQKRQRDRLPLIIGAAVLILLTAIGVVVYDRTSGDPATPPAQTQAAPATTTATVTTTEPVPPTTDATTTPVTPAGDPREQAAALDAVLSDSVRSRRKLNLAIQQVDNCAGLSAAVGDLRAVGDERRSQMDTVRNADLSALPAGETLRTSLISALQFAWEADQGFLQWAEPTLAGGCGAADDAGYARGRAASTSAGTAKRTFLAEWNPVARANGLSTRSADDI